MLTGVPTGVRYSLLLILMMQGVTAGTAGQASSRPLRDVNQGEFSAAAPRIYAVDAKAGDLISGTLEVRGTPAKLEMSGPGDSQVATFDVAATDSSTLDSSRAQTGCTGCH